MPSRQDVRISHVVRIFNAVMFVTDDNEKERLRRRLHQAVDKIIDSYSDE